MPPDSMVPAGPMTPYASPMNGVYGQAHMQMHGSQVQPHHVTNGGQPNMYAQFDRSTWQNQLHDNPHETFRQFPPAVGPLPPMAMEGMRSTNPLARGSTSEGKIRWYLPAGPSGPFVPPGDFGCAPPPPSGHWPPFGGGPMPADDFFGLGPTSQTYFPQEGFDNNTGLEQLLKDLVSVRIEQERISLEEQKLQYVAAHSRHHQRRQILV